MSPQHAGTTHAAPAIHVADAPIFHRLTKRERRLITRHTTPVRVGAGTQLAAQDSRGRELGIVTSGELGVYIDDELVATLTAGDVFGEMALLASPFEATRSADVVALTEADVEIMSTSEFRSLVTDVPAVLEELEAIAAERRRQNRPQPVAA